jgi:hypothetical protein
MYAIPIIPFLDRRGSRPSWGIASAMAMVVATAKGCDGSLVYKIMSSLIHYFSYRFHSFRQLIGEIHKIQGYFI